MRISNTETSVQARKQIHHERTERQSSYRYRAHWRGNNGKMATGLSKDRSGRRYGVYLEKSAVIVKKMTRHGKGTAQGKKRGR